jgi:hypothetical protein
MTAPIGFLFPQDSKWYRDVKDSGRRSMGLIVAKKLAEALKRPVSEFIEEGSAKK